LQVAVVALQPISPEMAATEQPAMAAQGAMAFRQTQPMTKAPKVVQVVRVAQGVSAR
jgi:hypothetical protein